MSTETDPTSACPNRGGSRQIIASVVVSLTSLLGGLLQGWNSPMTLKLQSEDSPVGPMSKQDIANLITLPSYVGFVFGISFIYIVNRFGRKPAMIVSCIPCAIGFIVMGFSKSLVWLYFGKILSVLSAGGFACGQTYVAETVHQSIRGILMSVCTMQINIGILLAYVLGKLLNFQWFNVSLAAVPIIFAVLMCLLPETPYFLAGRSRYDEAKKSLVWFRGGDVTLAENELEIIKKSSQSVDQEEVTLMQEMKQRATKIAIFVSFMGYLFQTLSGIHAVINYAGIIFDEAGSPLSGDDSAIVTAVLNLVATLFNLFLIDMYGRKPLLFLSFICGSISLAVLSVYLYVRENTGLDVANLGWIPLTSLGIFIFTYGLGLASVPGVLMNELAPTKVRPVLSSLIMIVSLILVLGIVQSFPFIDDNVGLYMCFAIPTVCNALGILFTAIAVPETKGKSLAFIANELNRSSK